MWAQPGVSKGILSRSCNENFFSLKPVRSTSLVLQGHLVTFGTDENLISFSCKNNTVTECSLIPLIAGRYS